MEKFIPAARFTALTERFDVVCALLGFNKKYREQIIGRVIGALPLHDKSNKKMRVLDVGCGTGTLVVELKKKKPVLEVYGIDPDAAILKLARKKMQKNNITTHLKQAFAQKLPFPAGFFDAAYSSLVWHHVPDIDKQACFDGVFRVLKKGGVFVLSDFGRPKHWWIPSFAHFARYVEYGKANYEGLLPKMMEQAGFKVMEKKRLKNSVECIVGKK